MIREVHDRIPVGSTFLGVVGYQGHRKMCKFLKQTNGYALVIGGNGMCDIYADTVYSFKSIEINPAYLKRWSAK